MVPVSVQEAGDRRPGNQVAAFLVDLPIGEPDPVVRLNRISFEMAQHSGERSHGRRARRLVALTGFAPPTLHALGARLAGDLSRRVSNIVVTNVPGPQTPLYVAGAATAGRLPGRCRWSKGMAVTIGLTSYNGGVFFGLNADRDAMDDIDVLTACIVRGDGRVAGDDTQDAYPRKTRPEGLTFRASSVFHRRSGVGIREDRSRRSWPTTAGPRRGLVLGGGGILGAAWMVGALKAVEEVHGFDPRTADYIVGTSAGSVLSALLGAGVSVEQLIDHQRGNAITGGPAGRLLLGLREGDRRTPARACRACSGPAAAN